MTDVFVDTNVLMDVLMERKPFFASSAELWTLCEEGQLRGHISVISFNNIFFIVRKLKSKAEAQRTLTVLRDIFTPVILDGQIINQAIDARFNDFEDAIQFHSALRAGAEFLITRNPADFPNSGPSILSPKEFLANHRSNRP